MTRRRTTAAGRGDDIRAREVPGWLSAALVVGALVGLLWLERRRPLRRSVEPARAREVRNLVLAALSAATIRLLEKPLVDRLAGVVHRRRWGLLPRLHLGPALEVVASVAVLDYTLFVWHVLTHRVPFLWRFHRVHHADLDLTASTALRFHFGEMALSVPWRAGQVLLIGATPLSVSVWQTLTLMAILFHHSNVGLPIGVERRLGRLVVTPRMHGIHHSIVPDEANANWGTILALPDYIHGTDRLDVPQREITLGVPEFRDAGELGLRALVRMPFGEQRPFWRLPGGGTPERRPTPSAPRRTLAG